MQLQRKRQDYYSYDTVVQLYKTLFKEEVDKFEIEKIG